METQNVWISHDRLTVSELEKWQPLGIAACSTVQKTTVQISSLNSPFNLHYYLSRLGPAFAFAELLYCTYPRELEIGAVYISMSMITAKESYMVLDFSLLGDSMVIFTLWRFNWRLFRLRPHQQCQPAPTYPISSLS